MIITLNPDEHLLFHNILEECISNDIVKYNKDEQELIKRMLVKLHRSAQTKSKTLNLYDLVEGDSIPISEPSVFTVEKITPATEDQGITLQFTVSK